MPSENDRMASLGATGWSTPDQSGGSQNTWNSGNEKHGFLLKWSPTAFDKVGQILQPSCKILVISTHLSETQPLSSLISSVGKFIQADLTGTRDYGRARITSRNSWTDVYNSGTQVHSWRQGEDNAVNNVGVKTPQAKILESDNIWRETLRCVFPFLGIICAFHICKHSSKSQAKWGKMLLETSNRNKDESVHRFSPSLYFTVFEEK